MTSVLIVNDIQALRMSWRLALNTESDMQVVDEAENGTEALDLAENHNPDVLLMGVEMSPINGIEATRQLRGRNPTLPFILLISTARNDEIALDAFLAGANGHILAKTKIEELMVIIRRIAAGEQIFPNNMSSLVNQRLSRNNIANQRGTLHNKLTSRETEVARLVALGLTHAEICAELFISESTVKDHVQSIYNRHGLTKQKHRNPRSILELALKEGYVGIDDLNLNRYENNE